MTPKGQSPEDTARPIRRRFAVDGRVRSGCLTCKARKKKCDGQASALDGRCRSCVRLGLVCEQLPLRRVAPRPISRSKKASQQGGGGGGQGGGQGGGAGADEQQLHSQAASEDDEIESVGRAVGSQPDDDNNDDDDDDDDNNINNNNNHNFNHGDGDGVVALGTGTGASGSRSSVTGDSSRTNTGDSSSSSSSSHSRSITSISNSISSRLAGSGDGLERVLLRYFLDHVAPLCSILQQDANSFSSVLLPMAIVDQSLLHALFAYASAHFDATTTPMIPMPPDAHLSFENQVARGVADAITKNAVTETTLACALVISTADVIGGDTSRWLLHLQGAGHLINHLGSARLLRSTDGAFLLRYFAYHDIMASLSTGQRTLAEGVYWVQDVDAPVRSADSFMGLAHHLFRHLTQICAFVADTADLGLSSPPERRSRATLRGEDMAQALRAQDLHLLVEDPTDDHIAALIHHAEAFRFAALFYCYRHLLRFCDAGDVYRLRMDDCVRHILEHVSQVPSNMFCEIGLMFPLFMAGIGRSNDPGTTQYICNRLTSIEAWTQFKHVGRVRELLQLLWDKGRTDWEVVLRELNWNLSLA